MLKLYSFMSFLILLICAIHVQAKTTQQQKAPIINCQSSREFITTHRYLQDHPDFGLKEQQVQKIAHKVSTGCTGAARRFIKSFELLLKAEVTPKEALQTAMALSQKSDAYTDSFVGIFTRSYLTKYMDMDFANSYKLAQQLSTEYKGNIKHSLEDFVSIADFCMSEEKLDLPKVQCGLLAGRVAKRGEHFDKPIAKSFIKAFNFIQSKGGLEVSISRALKIAEDIVAVSPDAVHNFIHAYRYGSNEKGLSLSKVESLKFAQTMTRRTIQVPASTQQGHKGRLPASFKKTKKD